MRKGEWHKCMRHQFWVWWLIFWSALALDIHYCRWKVDGATFCANDTTKCISQELSFSWLIWRNWQVYDESSFGDTLILVCMQAEAQGWYSEQMYIGLGKRWHVCCVGESQEMTRWNKWFGRALTLVQWWAGYQLFIARSFSPLCAIMVCPGQRVRWRKVRQRIL